MVSSFRPETLAASEPIKLGQWLARLRATSLFDKGGGTHIRNFRFDHIALLKSAL